MGRYRFKTKPMAHQLEALRKIAATDARTALLMDPGTGKTKVVVDYLAMRHLKYGPEDWLVTAPLSALDTWPDQIDEHLPDDIPFEVHLLEGSIEEKAERIRELAGTPRCGATRIVLVNHDAFSSRAKAKGTKTVTKADRMVFAIRDWMPDGLVVDECHRFKGHTSNRTMTLKRAINHAKIPRVIGLTGTVAPRNLLDVYGQWQLINPDRWGSWDDFRFRYARYGGWKDREILGWQRLDEFRELLLEDAYVARKADCLDLPPVTDRKVPVRLSPRERRAYIQMAEEMLADLPDGRVALTPSAAVKILRLRQLTGGFVGHRDEHDTSVETEFGRSKARVCADLVSDLVANGEKVVVFAHFRHDLTTITEEIRKLRNPPSWLARIDGDTPTERRQHLRKGFRMWGHPAVLVAQMRTMSLAVNELTVASHAIFYSLSERRDDYDQARDRLNRLGQEQPVTFHHLVVPDSIDTALLRAHREKLQLEQAVTDVRHELLLGEA